MSNYLYTHWDKELASPTPALFQDISGEVLGRKVKRIPRWEDCNVEDYLNLSDFNGLSHRHPLERLGPYISLIPRNTCTKFMLPRVGMRNYFVVA